MRLAYAPDASGRLEPAFVADVAARTLTRMPLQPVAPEPDLDEVWTDREGHHERTRRRGAAQRTRLAEAYRSWLPAARIEHSVS